MRPSEFTNKALRYISLLAIICCIQACNQEIFEYIPENECVTFTEDVSNYILDGNDLQIELARGVCGSPLDVTVSLEEGSIFTLADNTARFAENEFTTKIYLSYSQEGLIPGVEYSFRLRFDESMKSPAGICDYTSHGVLPLDMLEYEDYGVVEFIGPTSSSYPSDVVDNMTDEEKRYTLQVAKHTTTYYRIKNFFASPTDLDFILTNDGTVTVLAPNTTTECPVYSGETYKFETSAKYKGESFTVWFDSDPSCITPYDYSPTGYSAVTGTTIDFDALFTIGNDYIPRVGSSNMWHAYETFEVISTMN